MKKKKGRERAREREGKGKERRERKFEKRNQMLPDYDSQNVPTSTVAVATSSASSSAAPRKLPKGDCGFMTYTDPSSAVPGDCSDAQQTSSSSSQCSCRGFWLDSNSHTAAAGICACGHHACYHSAEPSPPLAVVPSSPSTFLTIGAYVSMMSRMARLEERLEAHEIERRNQLACDKMKVEMLLGGLRELDAMVVDLTERLEEAEERLFGGEGHGVDLEARLHDLEGRTEELEEDIEAIKAAVFDDERYNRELEQQPPEDGDAGAQDKGPQGPPQSPPPRAPPPAPPKEERVREEPCKARTPPIIMDEDAEILEADSSTDEPRIEISPIFLDKPPAGKARVARTARRRLSYDELKPSDPDSPPPAKRSRS